MAIMTGIEIVRMHREYKEKVEELQEAITKLEGFSYTRGVLESEISQVRDQLQTLESSRFQPIEAVTIVTAQLGGTGK